MQISCFLVYTHFARKTSDKGCKKNESWGWNFSLKVNFSVRVPLTRHAFSLWRATGSHRASNERSYIHLCPLLCVSLLYPLALPSPFSSGGVIDRLQQLRPPTALSSFGDTLSVLIRALIGRLAVGEWDQGLEHGGDNYFPEICFLSEFLPHFFLSLFSFLSFLCCPLMWLFFINMYPNIKSKTSMFVLIFLWKWNTDTQTKRVCWWNTTILNTLSNRNNHNWPKVLRL